MSAARGPDENTTANSHLLGGPSYGTCFQPENDPHAGTIKTWIKSFWKDNKLLVFIFLAVAFGFLVGLLINEPVQKLDQPAKGNVLLFLGFPGEILMRMFKMLILPLIITSLIIAFADLDKKSSWRLTRRALVYYLSTTGFAMALGILLVVTIKPGSYAGDKVFQHNADHRPKARAIDTILDLFRNVFPENIVQACIAQAVTGADEIAISTTNTTNTSSNNATLKTFLIAGETTYKPGSNILGIVVFSIAIGLLLGAMGTQAHLLIELTRILNFLTMKLVKFTMWYAPIGIWSLVTNKFASISDISGIFRGLAYYMATVISGLILHSLVVLPLTYFAWTRRNPFTFIKGTFKALLTAFGTSSSSATMPVTFKCLEDKNGIDKRVTRLVLPIGTTINMDGTALFEAVAAIFIAQSIGKSLSVGQYIAIGLTATIASISACAVPQYDWIPVLMVLQAADLPEESLTLIIPVDWFLDRLVTVVNVLGDCIGAGIVAHLSEGELPQIHIPQTHAPLELSERSYDNACDNQMDLDGSKTRNDHRMDRNRNPSTTSIASTTSV
uniref:Amino acid transporter n=1 Tax=Clytia hemisphaerica TaxID=252671 RepID=A0A7M6DR80_9CNID